MLLMASKMGSGKPNWRTMSCHGALRRFVLFSGAALWLTGFGAVAQERSFFTSGAAVSLTAAQASRGKAVYDDNCASCHGANLDDGEFGPLLRGAAFKNRWSSQSTDALFSYIATKMPPSAAGGLNDRAYADVEAYVLHANGVSPGSSELAPVRAQYDILASGQ